MNPSATGLHIAAVVLHDGGGFTSPAYGPNGRPANLAAALESQVRAPDQIIEISRESYRGPEDLSRSLHSRLLEDRGHARKTRTAGPGGVKVTSLWRTVERGLEGGFAPEYQWLWILPAGSLPAPDALQQLEDRLFTVFDEDTHAEIGIVGAKQLSSHDHSVGDDNAGELSAEDPTAGENSAYGHDLAVEAKEVDRLVNVGLWRSHSGELITRTEPRELDQGQYDGRDDVPAVSAPGMLVRARSFGGLGGFNPMLTGDYAAADFCLRAREVGVRTVIAPQARVRRENPPRRDVVHRLGGGLWQPADQRRSQILTQLAEAPLPLVPFLWVGQWFLAVARLVMLLAVKSPDAGAIQLGAGIAALMNWRGIGHLRRFRREGRQAYCAYYRVDESSTVDAGRRELRELTLSSEEVRAARRRDVTAETVGVAGEESAAAEAADLADTTGGDGDFEQMPRRRKEDRLGLFLLLTVLTGVSLVGFRELLTASALGGGAGLPASGSLAEVWHHTVSFLTADSLGERSAADPFTAVVLVLSLLSFGHASAVLLWIVILAAPLSALTAWWAAGLWSQRSFHRIIAALIWALLPALHTSVGQGRIGSVIAHILLPVMVLAALRAVRTRRRVGGQSAGPRMAAARLSSGWETAAAAALLLAVVTAAAPVLLIPAVVICAIAPFLLDGRAGRVLWLLPIPALALFAPMLISALDRGANPMGVLLSEPGRALSSAEAGSPAPLWQMLLGFSQSFDATAGLPGANPTEAAAWLPEILDGSFWTLRLALLIGAPLLLVAVIALIAAGQRAVAMSCAVIVLGILSYAGLATRLAADTAEGEVIGAYPGPLVSVVTLCLIAAACHALQKSQRGDSSLGGVFAPVATTLLVLAIFVAGVVWAAPRMLPDAQLEDQTVTAVHDNPVLIGRGSTRTLPASAADQGAGPAATRTLVLTSNEQGLTAQLVTGGGETIDKDRTAAQSVGLPFWSSTDGLPLDVDEPEAGDFSESRQDLADLVAAIAAPGSEHLGSLMQHLGIGFLLIPEGDAVPEEGAATDGSALVEAADTASGLSQVGATDFGMLWRAVPTEGEGASLPAAGGISGVVTSWARIVDAEGRIVALLPSEHHRVDTDLAEIVDEGEPVEFDQDEEYFLELVAERAHGWQAEVDGEPLTAATEQTLDTDDVPWIRRFHLPVEALDGQQAELTVDHRSQFQLPILLGVGGLFTLFILIAMPLPRSWRLLEVSQ